MNFKLTRCTANGIINRTGITYFHSIAPSDEVIFTREAFPGVLVG